MSVSGALILLGRLRCSFTVSLDRPLRNDTGWHSALGAPGCGPRAGRRSSSQGPAFSVSRGCCFPMACGRAQLRFWGASNKRAQEETCFPWGREGRWQSSGGAGRGRARGQEGREAGLGEGDVAPGVGGGPGRGQHFPVPGGGGAMGTGAGGPRAGRAGARGETWGASGTPRVEVASGRGRQRAGGAASRGRCGLGGVGRGQGRPAL